MMIVTVSDVVLRAVSSLPVRGALEIVELALACTFFLALPAVFLREEHVAVDVIGRLIGARASRLLRSAASALAVIILGLMTWQGGIAAEDAVTFGDVTPDLSIPRILYWLPVLIGLLSSVAAALALLVRDGRRP
jgi:TRAP-type C4-dicarboxylate transport system permease small subunit